MIKLCQQALRNYLTLDAAWSDTSIEDVHQFIRIFEIAAISPTDIYR